MPKIKTRKTLTKRVRLTKSGKIVRKHLQIGHLKRKMDASSKSRKAKNYVGLNKKYNRKLKRLLVK